VGEDLTASSPATATVELRTAMRGLCSEYFEHHVSPMLRAMQQAQEQQNSQLQDLRVAVEKKADAQAVPGLSQLQDLVAGEVARRSETGGVSSLVRLQEISALLQRKADSSSVPSLAQLNALAVKVDAKADAKDFVKLANLESLIETAQKNILVEPQGLAELRKHVASLEERLSSELSKVNQPEKQEPAKSLDDGGLKKVHLVIAAAGARFDKQLKELRQQLKALREEQSVGIAASTGGDERWPGRVMGSPTASEVGSETGSAVGSIAPSLTGSVAAGLGPEERFELKKIQAVVGAAGTAFSKEIKTVKRQVKEVQDDLVKVKELIGLHFT